MGETSKAHARRRDEGWYEKYIFGQVIDIGAGDDPLPCGNVINFDTEGDSNKSWAQSQE
jgi:hypothetical protein